jgi:hypothetical protein
VLWLAGRGVRIEPPVLTEALEQQVPGHYLRAP